MTPVRVAFVSSHAKLGGAERYLNLLLERLDAEMIAAVVTLEDGPFVARLRAQGYSVDVITTGNRHRDVLRSAVRLRSLLRASGAEVVHANGIKAAVTAAAATAATGLPLVWVKHDFTGDGLPARLVASRCAEVIGVSEAVVESLRGGRRERKVHVVHNGIPRVDVDTQHSRALVRALVSAAGPTRVVGLVGRVSAEKGHIELFAVLPELNRRLGNLHVVVVGDESPAAAGYADGLRESLRQAGVADAVSFLGFREDAIEIIAGCDVIAVPSVRSDRGAGSEGFGLVGLEALAVGTPVVGYEDGALREVLGDCALLVPLGDKTALAAALEQVLTDESLRTKLITCGLDRVSGRFSFDTVAAAMIERYSAHRPYDETA